MDYQTYLAATVKHVFSDLAEVEERLDSEPESFFLPTVRQAEAVTLEGLYEPHSASESTPPTTTRPDIHEPGLSSIDQLDLGLAA